MLCTHSNLEKLCMHSKMIKKLYFYQYKIYNYDLFISIRNALQMGARKTK